ncbi:hypothetical protein IF1G_11116 [Cordyceps javanica]|uniref:Uncharacterized protein n=1 Tax=Cordyceps javanica TaxID=43265 RepID=A0A545UL94_9HYPO|nr:hypothetical protein IF1G_11116 [Cordyceps javanica]
MLHTATALAKVSYSPLLDSAHFQALNLLRCPKWKARFDGADPFLDKASVAACSAPPPAATTGATAGNGLSFVTYAGCSAPPPRWFAQPTAPTRFVRGTQLARTVAAEATAVANLV